MLEPQFGDGNGQPVRVCVSALGRVAHGPTEPDVGAVDLPEAELDLTVHRGQDRGDMPWAVREFLLSYVRRQVRIQRGELTDLREGAGEECQHIRDLLRHAIAGRVQLGDDLSMVRDALPGSPG